MHSARPFPPTQLGSFVLFVPGIRCPCLASPTPSLPMLAGFFSFSWGPGSGQRPDPHLFNLLLPLLLHGRSGQWDCFDSNKKTYIPTTTCITAVISRRARRMPIGTIWRCLATELRRARCLILIKARRPIRQSFRRCASSCAPRPLAFSFFGPALPSLVYV